MTNKKYFIGETPRSSKKDVELRKKEIMEENLLLHQKEVERSNNFYKNNSFNLKHVKGRVIVKVDMDQKNFYTLSNGVTLKVERKYDNLDRSYTQQILGVVISAEHIPTDALLLFHFNSAHDSNLITNHSGLSGDEVASGIKIYSFVEAECFLWKMLGDEEWQPTKGFAIAERVYKPYEGRLVGLTPQLFKDTLFIKTGEYKGKVVKTLKACDYNILFRNEKGVDEHIVRCRHFENETHTREEIIAVDENLTEQLYSGKLWVGTTPQNAKPIK